MSGIGLTIDLQGIEEAIAYNSGVVQRLGNIRPLGLTLATVIQEDVDQRFDSAPGVEQSGTVYGGVTWDALTDAYLRANPRRQGGQQLRDTGELLGSFQVGDPNNIFLSGPDFVEFGSRLPKAAGLNTRRELLPAHEELIKTLRTAIEIYVVEGETDG